MIDVQRIKDRIDCRDLIERDLGRPKYRGATYSSHKCPLHNEEKGFSLVVYADGWHCFGKCGRGGDAISWLTDYHGLSFRDACERLSSGDLPMVQTRQHKRKVSAPILSEPPDPAWQEAAREVANIAMHTLWSKSGERAWRYLQGRGLTENTIVDAGLGYVPGDFREWRRIAGLNVPCGITIPWFTRGTIWGIKVRRAAGQPKYVQVRGGHLSGGLYLADEIQPGLPLLLTEGEFDALIGQQVGASLISAAAIGSAANRRINPCWYPRLMSAPTILIRMDDDRAGQGAAAQIQQLSQAARCVQVPHGKDVNAFYLRAGRDAVRGWLTESVRS